MLLFLHLWWSGVLVGVHVWLARPPRGQALRFKVFARNIVMTLIIEVIMIIIMTHIINVIMILVDVMVSSPEWEVWGWGGERPTQGGKPKGKWWRWGGARGTEKEKFEMFCMNFLRSRRWIIYAFQFLLWQCRAVRGLWLRESRPKARKKVWNRALKELLWYSASNDTIKRHAALSRMVEWLNGQLA